MSKMEEFIQTFWMKRIPVTLTELTQVCNHSKFCPINVTIGLFSGGMSLKQHLRIHLSVNP